MRIPCPVHQPSTWEIYMRNHPEREDDRYLDMRIAKDCCPDCFEPHPELCDGCMVCDPPDEPEEP